MCSAYKPIAIVILLAYAGYIPQINSEENGATALIPNFTVEASSIEDAPYLVSINGPESSGTSYPIGEGVILTQYLVLSSEANLLSSSSAYRDLYIRAGSNFSSTGGVVHAVNRIVIHPGFNRSDDISTNSAALLVLAKALTFSAAIQPVSLPALNSIVPEGSTLTFYSYNVFLTSSGTLRSAQLLSINQTTCKGFLLPFSTLMPEGTACAIAYGTSALIEVNSLVITKEDLGSRDGLIRNILCSPTPSLLGYLIEV